MIRKYVLILAACGFIARPATPAVNFFHLMQIEQVIGGVNGDVTAQAIQLRMRGNDECFITATRLWVRDAAGENPVLLIEFPNDVLGCITGDRILITSPKFTNLLDNIIQADFMLTNLIPESYLAAGTMTFEDSADTVFWRLSWGGKNYSGDTTGTTFNDADGEFGPPYEGPLPADSLQALQFQGSATAESTNNQDDYALTKGASTWTNNAGDSGTLVDANTTAPDDYSIFRGMHVSGDLTEVVDADDVDLCHAEFITIFPEEAPVTLDFDGMLPNDSPATLDVTFESSANTPSLEITISFFNYNTNSWDIVGTTAHAFLNDAVHTFAGVPADHVEAGTGAVRTRYEVRKVGPVITFPFVDCIDQLFWTTTD